MELRSSSFRNRNRHTTLPPIHASNRMALPETSSKHPDPPRVASCGRETHSARRAPLLTYQTIVEMPCCRHTSAALRPNPQHP
eukprot:10000225-Alexandrium_andersonii.AAC.1